MALPKAPVLFTKPRGALNDPYPAVIPVPKFAQDGTSDYEAELCVVIGKTGRNIPEDKALDYVLGYTASNDVSARTSQMVTSQWSFSKGLDGSCPIGGLPWNIVEKCCADIDRAGTRVAKDHSGSAGPYDQGNL